MNLDPIGAKLNNKKLSWTTFSDKIIRLWKKFVNNVRWSAIVMGLELKAVVFVIA